MQCPVCDGSGEATTPPGSAASPCRVCFGMGRVPWKYLGMSPSELSSLSALEFDSSDSDGSDESDEHTVRVNSVEELEDLGYERIEMTMEAGDIEDYSTGFDPFGDSDDVDDSGEVDGKLELALVQLSDAIEACDDRDERADLLAQYRELTEIRFEHHE